MHGLFTLKVKSSFLYPRQEMEELRINYILLRDRVEHEKNMLSLGLTTKSTPMQVLRGEILEGVPEADQPTDSTKVAVVRIERKLLRLECPTEDMARLSEEETNLLLAITSSERRYQTYTDRKRLAFGRQLSPGSAVFVEVKGASKVLPGIVRYKGVLPPSLGTWFGVELIEHPGSGKCNGTFRNKRYFICEPDSGIFVGLDKLTAREGEDDLQAKLKSSYKDSISSFWKGKQEQRSFQGIGGVLKIDDRVVTFIKDSPARGTVRYIGEEEDSTGNVLIIVGLELDERVGSGCGKLLGSQKFVCKRDYAAFVPLTTVIPEKEFDCYPEKAAKQEAQGKQEQIHEDEMYARSMSCVNVPSGRKNDKTTGDNFYGLEVGSMVEVLIAGGDVIHGVIRWLGNMPQVKEKLVAGLELEKEQPACSDGTFNKERYFTCPVGKGFFVLLDHCKPDSRPDQRLLEKEKQEGNGHKLVRELKEQVTHLQADLLEKKLRETKLHEQLRNKEQLEENLRKQLTEMELQLQEKDEETANLQNQVTALRQQLEEKDQEMNELETTLSTAQDELREYQRQQSPEWVISRDHIQLTSKFLGRGGWGSVVEGKYCGCSVAVKQIHELILSPHNRELFEREMDIASRCRHPCLLQFIGATNDEGNPLFVTELMETSLRTLLEQRALSEAEMSFIFLDVARALNYLHQKQPSSIIHRDISSANVLLWRQGEHWRGKVSDYGAANFMQQTMTVSPGAMIYSPPEALTKNQTVKVDVYSFGVLLCEMCIRELPNPERRDRQVALVKNKLNRALIRKCLQREPEARPSIQEIIDEHEQSNKRKGIQFWKRERSGIR